MPVHWHGNGVRSPPGDWALSNTKNLNGSKNNCALKPFNRCLRQALQIRHHAKTHQL